MAKPPKKKWSLKGMQAIARWNASRNQRRDAKRLQGFRQCELRLHDARHPVRVSDVFTADVPREKDDVSRPVIARAHDSRSVAS